MKDNTTDHQTSMAASSIPIEAVATYPLPGMAIPGSIAFSPDDRLITYLFSPDGSLSRQLYAFDPQTGQQRLLVEPVGGGTTEETVSLEEALRRERQRQREIGVTSYDWAKQSNLVLVPLQGDVYVQTGVDAPLRQIVDSQGVPALDPQLSPDGSMVAYVQDDELFVVGVDGGTPRQITSGARGTGKTHGLAEYVAQEEMGRSHGFWWSPDSQQIAFTEVDETHIPVYRIVHQGKESVGDQAQEDHHYPFAGTENARVRLGVVAITGDEPTWLLDVGDNYLARVDWQPDGSLCVQLENREQTKLELLRFDPQGNERQTLLEETNAVWINLHDMFKPLKQTERGAGGFIWSSERTGFRHLYLYDADGTLIRSLTTGDWQVDSLDAVDEARGLVYFTATRDDPRESHLYVVGMDGGEPRRITDTPGTHAVVIDHGYQRFVDVHHAIGTPPTVTLRSLEDGSLLHSLYDRHDPRITELSLQPPELVSLTNRSGVTLYGAVYRPPSTFGSGPFPTLVYVYGGPHAQLVTNGWGMTISLRAQYLRSLGFLVFMLDNQGSARRGLQFEGVIKHDMGRVEVEDQVDGVHWLIEQGLADPQRVGVYGWSYGGYMALMCLGRAPETFKVAVAGAPVTHLDGYDTHYTERYMGMPQSNADSYRQSSPIHYVEQMTGKLMLVHGLIDENVHFRHTARLINALIKARKPYDLLLFPDERHMPRSLADRVFMEERMRDYFMQHL